MENYSPDFPSGKKVYCWSSELELTVFALTQITKQQVDSFGDGQAIPSCILRAEWTKENKPSVLLYTMDLSGSKKPSDYWFRIELDSDSTQPGIPRGGLMCMIMCAGYQIL